MNLWSYECHHCGKTFQSKINSMNLRCECGELLFLPEWTFWKDFEKHAEKKEGID